MNSLILASATVSKRKREKHQRTPKELRVEREDGKVSGSGSVMSEGEKDREREWRKFYVRGERDHSDGKELGYIQLRFSAKEREATDNKCKSICSQDI